MPRMPVTQHLPGSQLLSSPLVARVVTKKHAILCQMSAVNEKVGCEKRQTLVISSCQEGALLSTCFDPFLALWLFHTLGPLDIDDDH